MPKPRAEINRKYYAKRTAHIERRQCSCGKRLQSDSSEICRACWLKTDDGREYLKLMKIKSRSKQADEK